MAVVGSASVVVRFITAGAAQQLKRDLTGVSTSARSAGGSVGKAFVSAFNAEQGGVFKKLGAGLQAIEGRANAARERLISLVRATNFLGPAITGVLGGIGALGGALTALVGTLSAAVPALAAVAGGFVALGVAAIGARIGLSGVGAAVSQATQANSGLSNSIRDINEELQQLAFNAEDAAFKEERAALNLEKARENLIRVQDLPPNSRARREAQLAYEEAELAFRRAKDQNADLQEDLEKGIAPSQAAAQDPYAQLNQSQKDLALFIVNELIPVFKQLEDRISQNFIPTLIGSLKRVKDEFLDTDELRGAFDNLGTALGNAANNFFTAFLDGGQSDQVISLINSMSEEGGQIEQLGTLLGNVFGIFLEILTAAQPVITQMFTDLNTSTGNTLKNLQGMNENGDLTTTFSDSYTVFKDLLGIIGLFIKGFGALGDATEESGAGGAIRGWLRDVGEGFAGLNKDQAFKDNLMGATTAGINLLGLIGDIIKFIFELGARPEVNDFITSLRDLGPEFETLFESFLEGLPGLSELIGNLVGIGNALTADGALSAFFDTLNGIAGKVREILETEGVQNFVQFLFPILQVFNAIALAGTIFMNLVLLPIISVMLPLFLIRVNKVMKIFLKGTGEVAKKGGALSKIFKGVGKVLEGIGKLGTFIGEAFSKLWGLVKSIGPAIRTAFVANPLGAIITVIGLVVAALAYFFTQTELGREIWGKVVEFFKTAWQGFADLFSTVIDNIFGFFKLLGTNLKDSWDTTVEGVKQIWDNVKNWFKDAFEAIGGFFEDVWNNVSEFFKGVINGLIGMAENFINFFIDGLNNMISLANNGLGFLGDLIGQELEISLIPKISIPRLAKGGVVNPSAGGQLVTVAEAGRPERIEPLDPDGLSKRDKAIIEKLSGGVTGNTINVYAAPGMDTKELAEEVSRRLAFKVRKGTF